MQSYLALADNVLSHGIRKSNRTGVDTLACFAQLLDHPLYMGFPLLTTKKMNFHAVAAELLWFLSGDRNITRLNETTGIWKPWADENNEVPYAYGEYWRRYPVFPKDSTPDTSLYGGETYLDQLRTAIDTLKKSPNSRRAVVVAWDPRKAPQSALPPCHYTFVLGIWEGRLCTHVTMRSVDVAVGVPYNIASYALLTHLIAKELKVGVGHLAITMVDCHVYYCGLDDEGANELLNGKPRHCYDHTRALGLQLNRIPYALPSLEVKVGSIDEAVDVAYNNPGAIDDVFELKDYQCHPYISMQVAV